MKTSARAAMSMPAALMLVILACQLCASVLAAPAPLGGLFGKRGKGSSSKQKSTRGEGPSDEQPELSLRQRGDDLYVQIEGEYASVMGLAGEFLELGLWPTGDARLSGIQGDRAFRQKLSQMSTNYDSAVQQLAESKRRLAELAQQATRPEHDAIANLWNIRFDGTLDNIRQGKRWERLCDYLNEGRLPHRQAPFLQLINTFPHSPPELRTDARQWIRTEKLAVSRLKVAAVHTALDGMMSELDEQRHRSRHGRAQPAPAAEPLEAAMEVMSLRGPSEPSSPSASFHYTGDDYQGWHHHQASSPSSSFHYTDNEDQGWHHHQAASSEQGTSEESLWDFNKYPPGSVHSEHDSRFGGRRFGRAGPVL